MDSATTITSALPPADATRAIRRYLLPTLTLGLLWLILCRQLSNEWSANEQYNYGWFVPFFAAYLFWLRWDDAPRASRYELSVKGSERKIPVDLQHLTLNALAVAALVALLPLRAFEVGNPDWRPLGWLHAFVVVGLTLLIIGCWDGRSAVRHFAFPVCFILVAVPWVSPIETPIVQGLMRMVAIIACEAVNLLGVPAQLEGSVIRISSGVVGVNEACSGVRSLQTSIMIGLLFGELKRLPLVRRLFLLAGAIAIALLANCARASFLVWVAATRDIEAVGRWHDLAGYAILVAVFLGTLALAKVLAEKPITHHSSPITSSRSFLLPTSYLVSPASPLAALRLLPLLWLLATEAAVECWYRVHEHNLVASQRWSVKWPENNPGFREIKIDENVRSTLRYDIGREATWLLSFKTSNPQAITNNSHGSMSMFFFRWEPGTASILRARSHRPDICLPNTGWELTRDNGVAPYSSNNGVTMPFRHFTFARPGAENRTVEAHAFFCESEDRIPRDEVNRSSVTAGTTSNWMRSDRLRVVLEGLRNQGQQVLEVVILTPQPLDNPTAEAEFAHLLPQIVH